MEIQAILLLLLQLIISLHLCTSSTTDTLNLNETLADGQVLVSNGERYTLGFFSPVNSTNRYLGIWYTKVSVQTVVWVANGDDPINDTSGVLSIAGQGGDMILAQGSSNSSSAPVWSANVSAGGNNTMARLLDEGNFVLLRSDGGGRTTILWQSLDHLSDTIFPNTKFGSDRRTGLNRSVRSWKSPADPAAGVWSYDLDPKGGAPQLVLYNGRTKWWRSGPRNGISWSGVPDMSRTPFFSISIVNDGSESTIALGLLDPSIISRLYVDPSGYVKLATWHDEDRRWIEFWSDPKEPCDYYGHCGPNGKCDPYNTAVFECGCLPGFEPRSQNDWNLRDGSGGCVRKHTGGNSTCGDGDGFVKVGNAKVPDMEFGSLNVGLDLNKCEQECLMNCSCMAYASANLITGIGCLTFYGDLMDTRVFTDGGQDLYVRVDAVELEMKAHKLKKVIVVVASLGAATIVGISIVFYLLKRKRKGKLIKTQVSLSFEILLVANSGTEYSVKKENLYRDKDSSVPIFEVNDIFVATGNFSLTNKLGQGGFGSVYKGLLRDGREVAVKRLSHTSTQGVQEFKNEVRIVSKLQHKNLARLYGCCINGEEKMLVYEYLPNRSLDIFIFDKTRNSSLDWKRRFDIIIGIARGILYLHQDSRLKIIHRDLKPSNVLLDAAMNPKISDFGMARLFGEEQTEANTNRVVGTYGYMSPEYAMKGLYSTKSDVFSFGVLTLEIISGMRSNQSYEGSPSFSLIAHVWDLWREGRAMEIVNPSTMVEPYSADQVIRCIHIGLLCVQESTADRPTMSNVVFMFGNETSLPSPNKPAFVIQSRCEELQAPAAVRPENPSINQVSITTMEAR
ncbi:unnamed protein product [Linum tenue]|uniref:Receptor-like serine/threonine-protein kinase n=1 Tax=Linum tenue TaxID=586396 RepID=A0AAV0NLS3_9ROSI|nr:unnamed protein product [Linum tenue]